MWRRVPRGMGREALSVDTGGLGHAWDYPLGPEYGQRAPPLVQEHLGDGGQGGLDTLTPTYRSPLSRVRERGWG